LNKIIVIGNLGRDPEMRYTSSGQSVTSFSVATNRRFTTAAGEQREETDWFNVSAWGRLSELCNQYLTKGQQVYLEGRLHLRSYETRDGQTRWVNDITVTDVQFLGRAGGAGDQGPAYDNEPDMAGSFSSSDDVDDLPF
jgi:single-strand DNA-binding protein